MCRKPLNVIYDFRGNNSEALKLKFEKAKVALG